MGPFSWSVWLDLEPKNNTETCYTSKVKGKRRKNWNETTLCVFFFCLYWKVEFSLSIITPNWNTFTIFREDMYLVYKTRVDRRGRMKGEGPSVPIQMESWFNGQCTSRISYFSMIIICWPGKLPTLLPSASPLHDGWKPISSLFLLLYFHLSYIFQIPMTFCAMRRFLGIKNKFFFEVTKMILGQTDTVL